MNLKQLKDLVRRPKPTTLEAPGIRLPSMTSAPHTHDYTFRVPGHDYEIRRIDSTGSTVLAVGFGPFRGKIRRGDYLTLAAPSGTAPRYRVSHITYGEDPPGMWEATLVYDPIEKRK